MRSIIEYQRPDYCPICNQNYLINYYDNKNSFVPVGLAYDNKNFNLINNRTISYAKCKKCNTKFELNWIMKKYPIPIYNNTELNLFIDQFKQKGENKNANRK